MTDEKVSPEGKRTPCTEDCKAKLCRKSVGTDGEFLERLQGYLLNSSFEKTTADQLALEVMKSLKEWKNEKGGAEDRACDVVEKLVQEFEVEGDFEYGMPIEKSYQQKDGSLIIFGKASGGDEDLDGEIVDQVSLAKLFPQYMENPVIKFMHGKDFLKHAIGVCLPEFRHPDSGLIYSSHFDESGPNLVAKISSASDVEPVRVKIKEGILKGFSIGGKLAKKVKEFNRDLGKFTVRVIPRAWTETSVVDTPSYRKATFGVLMKSEGSEETGEIQRVKRLPPKKLSRSKSEGEKMSDEQEKQGQGAADTLKISAEEKIGLFVKVARLTAQMENMCKLTDKKKLVGKTHVKE